MAKTKAEPALLELGVDFKIVSVGDKTASVPVSFGRNALSLTKTVEHFCERRLTGCIIAKPAGWEGDEQALPGMEADTELHGTFDTAKVSVGGKSYGVNLSFKLNEIDVATIAEFAKRKGKLIVNEVAALPENEDGDEE